jgi:hypothetical protein
MSTQTTNPKTSAPELAVEPPSMSLIVDFWVSKPEQFEQAATSY